MPHNWIQDPRSIPDEVITSLQNDLDQVPDALWHSADTFPGRVPEALEPVIEKAKEAWRQDFIVKRREVFQQQAAQDRDGAEEAWLREQQEFLWIYQEVGHPLWVDQH